jgi:hypothetical protein
MQIKTSILIVIDNSILLDIEMTTFLTKRKRALWYVNLFMNCILNTIFIYNI